MSAELDNINVASQELLITPAQLKQDIPLTEKAKEVVTEGRETINNILDRKDKRIFLVVGPCSIHDIDAAKDYALRLKELADKVSDTIYLVMRVYFEKPRTTIGWKGLINDPHLNDSFEIEDGLHIGRKLLIDIAEIGLPTATEALDPISPQYLQDTISWSAIGARTTESQTHREMASALPCSVGFKNGTDGGLDVAINALISAANPHSFFSMCQDGQINHMRSVGNPYGQLVLRGGKHGPNYDAVHLAQAKKMMTEAGLIPSVLVDCSHENSGKNHALQSKVVENILAQKTAGCDVIKGLMLESHLVEGRQNISDTMNYGQSVTDACIGWDETDALIEKIYTQLQLTAITEYLPLALLLFTSNGAVCDVVAIKHAFPTDRLSKCVSIVCRF